MERFQKLHGSTAIKITREGLECVAVDLSRESTNKRVQRNTFLKGTAWKKYVIFFDNELSVTLSWALTHYPPNK